MAEHARVTRTALEVALKDSTNEARVTRTALEVALKDSTNEARVTRTALEVAWAYRLSVTLVDGSGSPLANLTGLTWAWFEEAGLPTTAPAQSGTGGTTDGNGVFTFSFLSSNLSAGQEGTLILQTPDASRSAIVNIAI